MSKRILNIYNLVSLILVPSAIWGFDLFIHLLETSFPSTMIWIIFLTISLPICGYLLIVATYKYLSDKLPNMLPPEIPAVVGFLYAQPIYMIMLSIVIDGKGGAYPLSFFEAMKTILLLTPIVPISTVMISTYDGTLLAVPLTCLSIILAGRRCMKKVKKNTALLK